MRLIQTAAPGLPVDDLSLRPRRCGWRWLGLAAVLVLPACGPSGTPIHDPELLALFRPAEPISHEELVSTKDGHAYYSATLKDWPAHGFKERYVEELEERGFSIWPEWNSPHNLVQRRIGYNVGVVQEAGLDPYTIRHKYCWDGDDPDSSPLFHLRWNHPHPISVSGRRLTFELRGEFLNVWKTVVVVPSESLIRPPFDLPLPPTAAVVGVNGNPSAKLIPNVTVQLFVEIVARMPPAEFTRYYKEQLAGWGRVELEQRDKFLFTFGSSVPSWVLSGVETFAILPRDTLYSAPGVHVEDARHSFFRPVDRTDNGQFQAKSLRHVPDDAYMYSVRVSFRKDWRK